MTVKCNCQFLTYHAFVYTGGKMQDLNKLIPAHSGWVLTQALGINDSGQNVGWGIRKNQTRGFLLNPDLPVEFTGSGGVAARATLHSSYLDSLSPGIR